MNALHFIVSEYTVQVSNSIQRELRKAERSVVWSQWCCRVFNLAGHITVPDLCDTCNMF